MTHPTALLDAAPALFPGLDLGDARRDRRFRTVAQSIADNPGASLPQLFPRPADYNACLRPFDAPECSHRNALDAHAGAALDAMGRHPGVVQQQHDATVLDFSGHATPAGDLGPVGPVGNGGNGGNGGGRGWLAHQSLAVDPQDRTVFGLVSQILHVRDAVPTGETVAARRGRAGRENLLWQRGLDEIGPTPEGSTWVDVCDRGADVFEFLQRPQDRRRRFVVRSTRNRALGTGPAGGRAEGLLHDRLRATPTQAGWDLAVPAKAGKPGRVARPSAAALPVELRTPHVRKGHHRRESVPASGVRVWEANPPAGAEALEWLLLTSEPVGEPGQLRRVVDWYACRMRIEEFHKVQKGGLSVEGCQVQSVGKMAALVAVLSVVAVGLMTLRLAARDPAAAGRPAGEAVPRAWVEVLSVYQTGRLMGWTVGQFWVQLARLGGYHKDPGKHPPGWITLWRGWRTLHPIIRYENRSRPKMS